MQIIIPIFFAFVCLNLDAQAQNCAKYSTAMKSGYAYLNKKNYDSALVEFQAAQIAARECGKVTNAPATELRKVFEGLKAQRDGAVRAKEEAEKAKQEALSQKEVNQNQLARNYWNSSRAAMAEKNLLTALHFSAEAVATSHNSDLTKNLLMDAETYLPATNLSLILSHGNNLSSAVFSPDGKQILTAGKNGQTARLWDASTGKKVGADMIAQKYLNNDLSAVFSPDGKWVLTAGEDTTAHIWDAATGKSTGIFLHHSDYISEAFFSPRGKMIVTVAHAMISIWDAVTGKQIGPTIKQENKNNFGIVAAFSPDEKLMLTASDTTARLWKVGTGEQVGSDMNHAGQGRINSVVFSPDGNYILIASDYKAACLWETATTRLINNAMEHEGGTHSAVFSPDGKYIVTAGWDNTARIWSGNTGLPTGIVMKNKTNVLKADFSPDGKQVLIWGWDNAALWDAATGKPLGSPMKTGTEVKTVIFSPGGERLLMANEDGTVRVWEVGKTKATGPAVSYVNVESAAFTPDGKQLLTVSPSHTVQLLDVASAKPVNAIPYKDTVSAAVLSPDGKEIFTAGLKDGTGRLQSIKTGIQTGREMSHTGYVEDAVFSTGGKLILTVSTGPDTNNATDEPTRGIREKIHYISLWDARTGIKMSFPKMEVETAAVSPAGTYIVTTSYKTAQLYTVYGKKIGPEMEFNSLPTTNPDYAVFSPDGKSILTISDDGKLFMWETGKGKKPGFNMQYPENIKSTVFSADGKYILTTSTGKDGNLARLWETHSGKPVGLPMKYDDSFINTAVFSPDGKHILTSNIDGAACLWEAGTGRQVGPAIIHEKNVNKAIFSPDGAHILTLTNEDSTARLWNMEGDLDIPPDLFKLQAKVSTGCDLNIQTNEIQLIPSEQWYKLKEEYIKKAGEHLKICKYREYNFWSRFYPDEAKKIYLKK